MNILLATLKALKLPIKLLIGSKKKRKPTDLEQKQLKHVKNFSPTHYSWQKGGGKKVTKKQKEYYKKKVKNPN